MRLHRLRSNVSRPRSPLGPLYASSTAGASRFCTPGGRRRAAPWLWVRGLRRTPATRSACPVPIRAWFYIDRASCSEARVYFIAKCPFDTGCRSSPSPLPLFHHLDGMTSVGRCLSYCSLLLPGRDFKVTNIESPSSFGLCYRSCYAN